MEDPNSTIHRTILDKDVTTDRVLGLSCSDAAAEFFAHLGYNTKARMVQTPSEFGITNKSSPARSSTWSASQDMIC